MIIDLGEMPAVVMVDAGLSAPVPPMRPARDRRRRWLSLVALVTAFGLSASGVPAVHDLPAVRIPIGVNAGLMIVGTTAIVSDRRADANEVAAYDVATGRPLWRSPLAGTSRNAHMFVASSTVVVQTEHDIGYDQVEGFSLTTGARLWLMPALMVASIRVGLLVYQNADGDQIDAALIDPVTGDARWRTPIDADCDVHLATDPAQTMASGLLEVCPDTQEVTALDLATGAVRARIHPAVFPAPGPGGTNPHRAPVVSLAYLGDIAILAMPRRYPSLSLSAFRTSDLKPLWTAAQTTSLGAFTTCGPDVCVADGTGAVVAFDPATGASVTAPPTPAADSATAEHSALPGVTTTLVIVRPGQQAVLDPGIASADYRTPVAQGESRAVPAPITGDMWIAVAGGGAIRPLQFLHGVAASSCTVITSYVACTTAVDTVTVWDVQNRLK